MEIVSVLGLSKYSNSKAQPKRTPDGNLAASLLRAADDLVEPIELIAMDIDGTLVRTDNRISPVVAAAVREAVAAGVKAVLATARPPQEVKPVADELGIDTFQVTFNGALICAGAQNVLYHKTLAPDLALDVVRTARTIDPEVQIRVDIIDKWYTDRGSVHPSNSKKHHIRQGPTRVGPLEELITGPITRLTFLTGAVQSLNVRKGLTERFGEHLAMPFCGERVIMATSSASNKARALKRVVDHYGVPQQRVMSIGDAPNDIPMLKWAGIGVAMINAWMPAIEAADVLVKSNNHDGVAEAIRRYVFHRYD